MVIQVKIYTVSQSVQSLPSIVNNFLINNERRLKYFVRIMSLTIYVKVIEIYEIATNNEYLFIIVNTVNNSNVCVYI